MAGGSSIASVARRAPNWVPMTLAFRLGALNRSGRMVWPKQKWYYIYIYSTYMYLYVLSYPRPPQKQQDQYGKKMWENFQEDVAERPAPMVFCSGFFLGVKNPGGPPARPAASNLRECPTRRSR